MRNFKRTCGLLTLSVFLTLSACQKEDALPPGTDSIEYAESAYQLANLHDLENPEFTPGTETSAFSTRVTDRKEKAEHSLPFILRKLNLNQVQRTAIKGFVEQQSACIAEHRTKVQELHQEQLKKANAVREEYLKAYRAGSLTKAQLEEKLKALHERLRNSIKQDEQQQLRLRIMQKCRTELMNKIESVLNREQLQLWNRWKQSLP